MQPIFANIAVDYFHKGGPVMWPLLACMLASLAVLFERAQWWWDLRDKAQPELHEKIFSAALVGGFDRHIGGFGDISTGGTSEFNQLYIMEELPEEVLIPARGLGLDFSDQ